MDSCIATLYLAFCSIWYDNSLHFMILGSPLTLKAALNELHSVYTNQNDATFHFGLLVDVPHYRLEIIRAENIHPLQLLAEILEYWVVNRTNYPLTWKCLSDILEDLEQYKLAHELREKYCYTREQGELQT